MATDHKETVRAFLETKGIPNVVAGQHWPAEDEAVIIMLAPGLPPIRKLNGGVDEMKREGVQILVRGKRTETKRTGDRAREIYDLMRFAPDDAAFPSQYWQVDPLGGPADMDDEEDERPLVTMNFIMQLEE